MNSWTTINRSLYLFTSATTPLNMGPFPALCQRQVGIVRLNMSSSARIHTCQAHRTCLQFTSLGLKLLLPSVMVGTRSSSKNAITMPTIRKPGTLMSIHWLLTGWIFNLIELYVFVDIFFFFYTYMANSDWKAVLKDGSISLDCRAPIGGGPEVNGGKPGKGLGGGGKLVGGWLWRGRGGGNIWEQSHRVTKCRHNSQADTCYQHINTCLSEIAGRGLQRWRACVHLSFINC